MTWNGTALKPTAAAPVPSSYSEANSGAEAVAYNGKTWTIQTLAGPGKGKADSLEGVSCPKAVGYWNGKSWKLAAA